MRYGYLVYGELGKNHKMVCQISLYIQNTYQVTSYALWVFGV